MLGYVEVSSSNGRTFSSVQILDDNLGNVKNNTRVKLSELFGSKTSLRQKFGAFVIGIKRRYKIASNNIKEAWFWTKSASSNFIDYLLDDADTYCRNWYANQPSNEAIQQILNSLPPCPPRVTFTSNNKFPNSLISSNEILVQDKACLPEPTRLESLIQVVFTGGNCKYHKGAKACYRSDRPGNVPVQQCCYSSSGQILVGVPNGGTLDMHSGKVDHYLSDVISYKACCVNSKDETNCEKYYEKRPSDNGDRWRPPNPGI